MQQIKVKISLFNFRNDKGIFLCISNQFLAKPEIELQ